MTIEFSAWFSNGEKPDLNGVYQCRFTAKPDDIKYHLYRNGWRVGCDSAEEAEKAIEKFYLPFTSTIRNSAMVFVMGGIVHEGPVWEWRGLAKKPAGLHRYVTSDKYK